MGVVVKRVQWQLKVVNATSSLVTSDWASLSKPQIKKFTQFAEITQEQMLGWATDSLGETKMEQIASELESRLDGGEIIQNHPLPWEAQTQAAFLP